MLGQRSKFDTALEARCSYEFQKFFFEGDNRHSEKLASSFQRDRSSDMEVMTHSHFILKTQYGFDNIS